MLINKNDNCLTIFSQLEKDATLSSTRADESTLD
jgi:hypothetical protein